MRLEDYDTGTRYSATVLGSDRLTPENAVEVRELLLRLDVQDFHARAGQSVGVIVDGSPELGNRHHFRLYTLAEEPIADADGHPQVKLCVRRCNYLDEYSGEEYRGVASNFLCDLRPGDKLTMNGPFGLPFALPGSPDSDLLLISMGTGIAPFRAFINRLYAEQPERSGRVWLFHGAMSGLELLYMNDERDDFTNYYDRNTFNAFKALSPRPHWADPIAMDYAIEQRAEEIWTMLQQDSSYVYLAGKADLLHNLDAQFAGLAGDPERWQQHKQAMIDAGRWTELLY
jgi:ferredoxin--NADP+ reductase